MSEGVQVRGAELCAFYLSCSPAFYSQLGFYVLWFFGIKYTANDNLEENVGVKSFGYEISNVMRVSSTVIESWLCLCILGI